MPNKPKLNKFKEEQQTILEKIMSILNYNNNYTFYLHDLDNNLVLQQNIMELSNDIKSFYPSSSCIGINGKDCKRPYLSVIKYLLKFHNKELYFTDSTFQIDGKNIRTKKYKII
jgi:hypothetical protein